MLLVADTSALLAVAACQALPLLDALSLEVRVPHAVFLECTVQAKPNAEALRVFLRGRVVEVDLADLVIAAGGLGQGELEAMALCKSLRTQRLLVDDARARRVARLNGIEVIGSLGILLLAKERGLVNAVRPMVERVQASGIHVANHLIQETLRLAGE